MKNIFLLLIVLLFACSENNSNLKFIQQSSLSDASFRGLSIVNENVAWVTGSKGTVLKTVDGGLNWQNVSPVQSKNIGFRDVHSWNHNEAIIMGIGSPAIFLKTVDGGKNWSEVYRNENPSVFFDSFEFWNDSSAVSFSDPINGRHFLIKTNNYGESWMPVDTNNIPKAYKGEAGFAASGTCIATIGDSLAWMVTGGSEARVFYTENQGELWLPAETPIIHGLNTTGIYSVSFLDENNGFIVGGDYTRDQELNANAAISKDGGKTWELLKNKPKGFKSCVTFLSGNSQGVLVTGTSGTDISYDFGNSWTQIDTTSFNTIGFAKNGTGWAVGDKGLIYKMIYKREK